MSVLQRQGVTWGVNKQVVTKELEQALLRQKTGDVEKDVIDVIAKALGLEYGMAARVAWALRYATYTLRVLFDDEDGILPVEASIEDDDVKEAIAHAIHCGVQRITMARAITNSRSVSVSPQALVTRERAHELCRGCPESLDCAAQRISTPEKCWDGRLTRLVVFPTQINGDLVEVEAQQPQGKHIVRLSVINATLHR